MNEADGPTIIQELHGSVAIVRFNRPSQRNSLSSEILHELNLIVPTLDRATVRAIVFTGTDDLFLSGADIRELTSLGPNSARVFSRTGQQLMQHIADASIVTIAAINGYCFGGGMDLAMACKIRVASPSAVFAHPGARLGIITGWGGTQRLTRLIGKARAIEMFATARVVKAEEALQIGLVQFVQSDPLEFAIRLVEKTLEVKAP
jgi:enoyl-CoA hydratase